MRPARDRRRRELDASTADLKGTVGAVALDGHGTVAAATSTGGVSGTLPGRVGDTPLIGCGTYANSALGGVSCTGTGEAIIRGLILLDWRGRIGYAQSTPFMPVGWMVPSFHEPQVPF